MGRKTSSLKELQRKLRKARGKYVVAKRKVASKKKEKK